MAERHLRYRGAFAPFGQYTVKERRWHCQNCGVCKLKSTLQDILAQEQLYPPVPVQYLEYSTVSTQPIPFKLSRDSAKTYHEQITQGLRLPTNLFQSTPFCIHGNIFNKKNLVLAREGIVVYSESDVLDLKEHKGKYYVFVLSQNVLQIKFLIF